MLVKELWLLSLPTALELQKQRILPATCVGYSQNKSRFFGKITKRDLQL